MDNETWTEVSEERTPMVYTFLTPVELLDRLFPGSKVVARSSG